MARRDRASVRSLPCTPYCRRKARHHEDGNGMTGPFDLCDARRIMPWFRAAAPTGPWERSSADYHCASLADVELRGGRHDILRPVLEDRRDGVRVGGARGGVGAAEFGPGRDLRCAQSSGLQSRLSARLRRPLPRENADMSYAVCGPQRRTQGRRAKQLHAGDVAETFPRAPYQVMSRDAPKRLDDDA